MPPHAWARRGKKVTGVSRFKTERIAYLTGEGKSIAHNPSVDLGGRQTSVLGLLNATKDGLGTKELKLAGFSLDTLNRLFKRGLLQFRNDRLERDPFDLVMKKQENGVDTVSVKLTEHQEMALKTLSLTADSREFRVSLLKGVTGSGKTELYLRLAKLIQTQGRAVIVLVPEIVLAPAVARRFRSVFGSRVAIQHSGLSEGERHDQWHRIRRGEIDIVVGTRSAVFAPLDKLGLIVVDEEHDSSYKQEETPRYHARDVAVMRARQAKAMVLLGSATPSMESYHNAVNSRYDLVILPTRVGKKPLPRIQIVDMREALAEIGSEAVLSSPLVDGLENRLRRSEQSLVLLNRR